jgi:hypothetical protein
VRGWGVNISEDARHWIGLLQYNPSTLILLFLSAEELQGARVPGGADRQGDGGGDSLTRVQGRRHSLTLSQVPQLRYEILMIRYL